METTVERKKRIENLRKQLPFLNKYQRESQNEELKKHSLYILNLFKKSDEQGKDINIPDHKIDLLIASVEKLKEYTKNVKKDEIKKAPTKTPASSKKEIPSIKKEAVELKRKDEIIQPMTKLPAATNNSLSEVSSSSSIDLNISDKERKRREKELRRLQENIVKDEVPLPSRRVIKRNSRYMDSSTVETPMSDDEFNPPSSRRRSDAEKSIEKKPLPTKLSPLAPAKLPSRISSEFVTSTPKNSKIVASKSSTSTERILPMKRRSDVTIEKLSEEQKVPPLKISTLAKRAAEKTNEIKRVLPIRINENPPEKASQVKKGLSKNQLNPEVDNKLKKVVLTSPEKKKSEEKKETKEVEKDANKLHRKDIENMGYVAVRSGFIFQCLAEKCFFNTTRKFAFINHLEESHFEVNWSGHCKSCSCLVIVEDKSKEGEFWHMMEKHVMEEKNNVDELPDILEIPKKEETSKTVVSKEMNNSVPTANERPYNDSIASEENSSKKIEVKEKEAPKISVKSFANLSKFSPQETLQKEPIINIQATKPTRIIQPKVCEVPKKDEGGTEKLLARPKVVQIPNKDLGTAVRSQIDLKALMQKQTEENRRKLQAAAMNVLNIPSVPQQIQTKKTPIQARPQEYPQEEASNKPTKFFIRKPTSSNSDIQVDDNKTPKDTISLRPWLTKPIKKFINQTIKLLQPPALISTFKCMGGQKCEFFTNDQEEFERHLNNHLSTNPGDIANYIMCPYCDFDFSSKYSIADLITHILDEHGYDNYQCKYCFYRSCANFNVIEHQKIHHRMQQHSIIKLENTKQRDYDTEKENIVKACFKFVRPLVCATCKLNGAAKRFFVLKHYLSHLKDHERNKEIIKVNCKKCSKQVDGAESLYAHIFQCFDTLAFFQCVYCLFGTNSENKIYEHISNCHPSKMAIICERTDDEPMKRGAQPHEYLSTSLKFITKDVDEKYITAMASVKDGPSSGIQIQNVYSLSSNDK